MGDYQRDLWPVDEQGFNALDPLSAEELGECYACIVGVWTGPASHSHGCPCRNDKPIRLPCDVDGEEW